MFEWLERHQELLTWLFALSLGSLVLTAALLPIVVLRLPADYFLGQRTQTRTWTFGSLVWHILKNLLGVVFVLAGIAMLVLPGQGLLTILIGMLLMDFPGKHRLEAWFVGRPRILDAINRLRQRRNRPPLLPPP